MPEQYEKIRDAYVRSGKSYDKAQELAARTYNKLNKGKGKSLSEKRRNALKS